MDTIGKQDTFWNLINEYKIVVPKIQRDYVQGRENKTVEKNREEFVKELIGSLAENKPMSLNFVYGTIHGDEFIPIDGQQRLTTLFLLHLYVLAKKGDIDAIGKLQKQFSYQTRYTTNRLFEELAKDLPNLSKSDDFAQAIRASGWYVTPWDNDPNILSCIVMLGLIHENYKQTINGNDEKSKQIAELLIADNCPITFMWLQLDKSFGSDNQLYIRMNSRGKQLTDFENFKAELYEKVLKSEKGDNDKINNFKKNIDGDWYSLFWDAKLCRDTSNKNQDANGKNKDEEDIEKRATLIDRLLQHIFHWTIVSSICNATGDLTSASKNDSKEFVKNLYSDLQPGCEIEKTYIQEYIELYQNREGFENVFTLNDEEREKRKEERIKAFFCNIVEDFACTLSFLSELKREKAEKIFRFIINDIFQINYGNKNAITYTISQYGPRVLLYAITRFAKEYEKGKNNKIDDFNSWYRVVLNLVSTQEIDSPEDFQAAIKAIDKCELTKKSCDINEIIESWLNELCKVWKGDSKEKRAFRLAQVEEEILKIKMFKNGDWESAIRNAENTNFDSGDGYKPRDYFRGQIGFLLHMAGVEAQLNDLDQKQLNNFVYYSKAVRCIFNYDNWNDWKSDEITNKPTTVEKIKSGKKYSFDNLFHRAMLIYGNYWVIAPGNNIKTFFVYNESHNNYDWRGAFRQKDDGKWGTAVGYLKDLLENYIPKNSDKYSQEYKFDFDDFKDYLVDRIKAWAAGQIGNSNVNETAEERRLRDLLIQNPNCFKYIRNNYYIYWNDTEQEYLLMSLKRFRKDSFIDIKKELQGQTP